MILNDYKMITSRCQTDSKPIAKLLGLLANRSFQALEQFLEQALIDQFEATDLHIVQHSVDQTAIALRKVGI